MGRSSRFLRLYGRVAPGNNASYGKLAVRSSQSSTTERRHGRLTASVHYGPTSLVNRGFPYDRTFITI